MSSRRPKVVLSDSLKAQAWGPSVRLWLEGKFVWDESGGGGRGMTGFLYLERGELPAFIRFLDEAGYLKEVLK